MNERHKAQMSELGEFVQGKWDQADLEKRDLTADERKQVEEALVRIKTIRANAAAEDRVGELGRFLGGADKSRPDGAGNGWDHVAEEVASSGRGTSRFRPLPPRPETCLPGGSLENRALSVPTPAARRLRELARDRTRGG